MARQPRPACCRHAQRHGELQEDRRQGRSRVGRVAAILVILLISAGRSPAQPAPPAAPANTPNPDDPLTVQTWQALQSLGAGEDWAKVRAALADGLRGATEAAPPARRAVDSILAGLDETIRRLPSMPTIGPDASVAELVAALPETRIEPAFFERPCEYDQENVYIWDRLVARRRAVATDPAILLYQRGRSALPQLVAAIGDTAATRAVNAEVSGRQGPVMLRVGDVAIGLVEAIAHRGFREGSGSLPPTVSDWPAEMREVLAGRVSSWVEGTRELDVVEAVLWKLDEEPHVLQIRTLQGLLRGGFRAELCDHLETRFRNGNELRRDLPVLLLRAGSRAPLEFVARQAASGLMLTQDKVELVAQYGADEDFRNLAQYVRKVAGRDAANTPSHMKAVVDGLRQKHDGRSLAVLAAVLAWEVERLAPADGRPPQIPLYVDDAADLVERWSGVPFGHRTNDPATRRMRSIREILYWWRAGGQSAYDPLFNAAHASGGLR